MQIKFWDIHYDDKYIYAFGEDLLTGTKKNVKISRTDDKDFWCEDGYETVFFRGAVVLMATLIDKGKLPSKMSFMLE